MTFSEEEVRNLAAIYQSGRVYEALAAYADTLSKPADSGRVGDVEKVLAALGHVRVPNTRCLARVAEIPKELAPPGPHNPPIWCCLPEGHDGKHRHNSGGMYPSIAFRDTDEVVMGDPLPDYCEKCRRIWPCDEAAAVTAALAAQGQGNVTNALLRGRAQDEEPRVQHTCNMGVGCEEAGVCYADAHGEPEQCGRTASPAGVPDEATDEFVPRWWDESHGDAYKEGWNDCRATLLAAAPSAPEGGEVGCG